MAERGRGRANELPDLQPVKRRAAEAVSDDNGYKMRGNRKDAEDEGRRCCNMQKAAEAFVGQEHGWDTPLACRRHWRAMSG